MRKLLGHADAMLWVSWLLQSNLSLLPIDLVEAYAWAMAAATAHGKGEGSDKSKRMATAAWGQMNATQKAAADRRAREVIAKCVRRRGG